MPKWTEKNPGGLSEAQRSADRKEGCRWEKEVSQGREHQLVIQFHVVNHENKPNSSIMWTEQGIF